MTNFNFKISSILVAGEFISNNFRKGFPLLKTALRTTLFRTGWYSDDHDELERIYRTLKDPWNFETSQYEQDRLNLLLEVVAQYPHESILEIGCAEGLFTDMLKEISGRVVAIDVSRTAIARAQKRSPTPQYMVASLEEFKADEKFDMVICAETLYYIKDIPGAINQLTALGRCCVVSYLERESKRLDAYFQQMPSVELKKYKVGNGISNRTITVAVWKNAGATRSSTVVEGKC